jgi:hypothetical protein
MQHCSPEKRCEVNVLSGPRDDAFEVDEVEWLRGCFWGEFVSAALDASRD